MASGSVDDGGASEAHPEDEERQLGVGVQDIRRRVGVLAGADSDGGEGKVCIGRVDAIASGTGESESDSFDL